MSPSRRARWTKARLVSSLDLVYEKSGAAPSAASAWATVSFSKTRPFAAPPQTSSATARNSAGSSARLGLATGRGADDRGSGADQVADPAQDGERHVPAVGVERQQAVAHARGRRDPAVGDRQAVEQGVGVDEVEVVAGRDVGQLRAEQGRDVGILAVEVEHIGHEAALLQHVRAPGQIGRPGQGHIRPGLVSGEPLAERPEPEAGDLVVDGLVDRGVDDEAVQPVRHHPVGGRLQRLGRVGPGVAVDGQGLGRDQVLAVDVGDRGGFADVGVVLAAGLAGPLEPGGAHGDVGQALHVHAVADESPAGLVGFRVAAHIARPQDVGELVVVVLGDEVAQGLAEIPEEPVARLGAFDDPAGQDRQPGAHVVAAALRERVEHPVGPVGDPGLPAVGDHVLKTALAHEAAGGALVLIEVVLEIGLDVGPVELVDLEPGGLRRGRASCGRR